MANVYKIKSEDISDDFDENNNNYQLASVAYVNTLIKKLEDLIISHENSDDPHSKLKDTNNTINMNESLDIKELNISNEITTPIDISMINTDSNHKFISDSLLSIFKDKPSEMELQSAIMDLRNEFKVMLNNYFTNLLNMSDSLQKIKDLSYFINEDDNLSKLLSVLSSKLDKESFSEHDKSIFHLNNNDRKALNLLLSFISEGCADWNADQEAPNYIRNKPESLPANGGNADTISGYSIDALLNHQIEDSIIGVINGKYNKERADIILTEDADENAKIIRYIKNKTEGMYSFLSGTYLFTDFYLNMDSSLYGNITIKGTGNRNTIFKTENGTINGTIYIKDIVFIQSELHIISNCTFDNVRFVDCTIHIDGSNEVTIKNCILENCTILTSGKFGTCNKNIIIYNRFIKSHLPNIVGLNNIIDNNIEY